MTENDKIYQIIIDTANQVGSINVKTDIALKKIDELDLKVEKNILCDNEIKTKVEVNKLEIEDLKKVKWYIIASILSLLAGDIVIHTIKHISL